MPYIPDGTVAELVDGNPWVAPNLVLHYVTVHGYVPPTRVYDAPPDLVASVLHKGYPDIAK